jgi:hypothetical protein
MALVVGGSAEQDRKPAGAGGAVNVGAQHDAVSHRAIDVDLVLN